MHGLKNIFHVRQKKRDFVYWTCYYTGTAYPIGLWVTSKNSCPALRRIFCPSFSCKKLEIHKGFLRFLPFNLRQNLSAHHQT